MISNVQVLFMLLWSSLSRSSSAWTTIIRPSRHYHAAVAAAAATSGSRRSMATLCATKAPSSLSSSSSSSSSSNMINLQTIQQDELEQILTSWGHPKYRAKQIYNWVRVQGVTNIDDMQNIPKKLKQQLKAHASEGSLELAVEQISKDGTRKRAYKLPPDGNQLIESVLMPYRDGRYTACISSQAGCAQGCVFCATGQMGFSRQLTADEIFEQVARFSSELAYKDKHGDDDDDDDHDGDDNNSIGATHNKQTRLSNIVFMGMGEPLANYRNVVAAVKRIQSELGIGYRKITISTVGIVPNIAKLATDLPQVRLAVSLHCATDEERTALLPANLRYGGLDLLMETLRNYSQQTKNRITLEWALIEQQNDTPETAHQLGKLVKKWLRPDMVHINVIPLNPTGGYGGSPSGRSRVNAFCEILEKRYGVACTPRVRRGIDIDAGCGQLTAKVDKKQKQNQEQEDIIINIDTQEEEEEEEEEQKPKLQQQKQKQQPRPKRNGGSIDDSNMQTINHQKNGDEQKKKTTTTTTTITLKNKPVKKKKQQKKQPGESASFAIDENAVVMSDDEDWEDYEYRLGNEKDEVARLLALVKDTVITEENGIVTGSASSSNNNNNNKNAVVKKK